MTKRRKSTKGVKGRLRIGDNWNAINIIALSQSNPLKAVAEFVENCIDARAENVTIIRGKERGEHYLRVIDDGRGIPLNGEGVPDFKYVATHICDSIKRQLKKEGATGIQGEFGIGLLSFWTVGEELRMVSSGSDGKTYQMRMAKGDPGYEITQRRVLLPQKGTEMTVAPLLSGVRSMSGEKMQRYLASELRDRIRQSHVNVKILDRVARKEFKVEPRKFEGRLLHRLPAIITAKGEIYTEIYLNESENENGVGLYRLGTRVYESITALDDFNREPWTSGWLEGIMDVPFLHLTPGTRSGIIFDDAYDLFKDAIGPLEEKLLEIINEQKRAEEERASKKILKSVQNALKEAILSLPMEEYDWFDIHREGQGRKKPSPSEPSSFLEEGDEGSGAKGIATEEESQRRFFEFAGPLFSVRISPSSTVVSVGKTKEFRAIARDRNKRTVDRDLVFHWEIMEGGGSLDESMGETAIFTAPEEPCLTRLKVTVSQGDISTQAEALVTVTDSLLPRSEDRSDRTKGLPGYTFRRAPGELWRSKYDDKQNVIVINNGHRDFVYASQTRARKLRYICRLFAKELVLANFPGEAPDKLLERMVELTIYTEEHLK